MAHSLLSKRKTKIKRLLVRSMSSSESDSEFDIRKEGDDEGNDDLDDGPPAWMIKSNSTPSASSTSQAPEKIFDATKILEAAAAAAASSSKVPEEDPVSISAPKTMEQQFASPEEMVERLVSKEFKSAFEVLQISPDA